MDHYDLAIVGAGIVGLAHAWHAHRAGLSVVVVDRELRTVGASIRNFGLVSVTGQRAGDTWRRARRSARTWRGVAAELNIPIGQVGCLALCHREESIALAEAFAGTEMGEQCVLLSGKAACARMPMAVSDGLWGALYSPHELRVEPEQAIAAITQFLALAGVRFVRPTAVHHAGDGRLHTTAGTFGATRIVIAPGPDLVTLAANTFADADVHLCALQMMRIAPQPWRAAHTLFADWTLARYPGFAELAPAAALRASIARDEPDALAAGVHLIVVQSADGSLVVGDSHRGDDSVDPFLYDEIERIILRCLRRTVMLDDHRVVGRWQGIYPAGHDDSLIVALDASTRLVSVTSGTGMSTAFGIAEEVLENWSRWSEPQRLH